MIGSIKYDDGTNKINQTLQYRSDSITGWVYIQGDNGVVKEGIIAFGKTFVNIPEININGISYVLAIPVDKSSTSAPGQILNITPYNLSTTGSYYQLLTENSGETIADTKFFIISFEVKGKYS
jgi:hypothetical protein